MFSSWEPPRHAGAHAGSFATRVLGTQQQEIVSKEWILDGVFDLLRRPRNYRKRKIVSYDFIDDVSHETLVESQRTWHR